MYLLAEALLAGILLGEVLLFEVLLAAEGEMVLAVSALLEKKERIPPELEIPEEVGALLLSGALFVLWYSWHLFSFADWTGGHRYFCFWSLPMRWYADIEGKIPKYKCNRYKSETSTKKLKMYLERLCQGRGSYRWRYLSSPGGNFLEAYTSMHDGGQSGSVIAD